MNDKKMIVHPALTEFALQSAKDWEAVAQERLGVIERLCAEVERLQAIYEADTNRFERINAEVKALAARNAQLVEALELIIESKCVQPWIGIAWTKALAALSAKG